MIHVTLTGTSRPVSISVPVRPLRARDVPDFRLELLEFARGRGMELAEEAVPGAEWQLDSDRATFLRAIGDGVARSRLWWVTSEMTQLVAEVAEQLPDETTLTPDVIPEADGLVAFAEPIYTPTTDGTPDMPVVAMSWFPMVDLRSKNVELKLCVWADMSTRGVWPERAVLYCGAVSWPMHGRLSEVGQESIPDFKVLASLFALTSSPGITDARDEVPDRAARRRHQRVGVDLTATRVLYLKGDTASTAARKGEPNRYHHRWIVRGHWRSQPHGPARSYRKPVFIAPHVKGPEGAPLLTGEKVTVINRGKS